MRESAAYLTLGHFKDLQKRNKLHTNSQISCWWHRNFNMSLERAVLLRAFVSALIISDTSVLKRYSVVVFFTERKLKKEGGEIGNFLSFI